MTTMPILVLGTPGGTWAPFAKTLMGGARADASIEIDIGATRLQGGGAGAGASARYIVFVESLEECLAAALCRGDSPQDALRDWHESAKVLLRHIHSHVDRTLAVAWSEAVAAPALLSKYLNEWLGQTIASAPGVPEAARPDPLALAVARTFAAAHEEASVSFDELFACCVPFSGIEEGRNAWAALGEAAWRRYGERAKALAEQRDEAAARSTQLQAELQQLHGAASESRQELALLGVQMAQMQEELEALYGVRESHEREVSQLQAELERQRQTGAQQLGALSSEVQREREAAASEKRELQALLQRRDSALEDKKIEVDLLQIQLQQVQEELEHHYQAYTEFERRELEARFHPAFSVELLSERNVGPHRELAMLFRGLKSHRGNVNAIEVRLVEHHGMPGLVFFQPSSGPIPFGVWVPTGIEGERPYMALLPQDSNSEPLLKQMPSSDRMLVQEIVECVDRFLSREGNRVAPEWRTVAEQLRWTLGEEIPRLRYDALDAHVSDDGEGLIEATFRAVVFGTRRYPELTVLWHPSSRQQPVLEIMYAPESGHTPPMSGWPRSEEGILRDRFALPVGRWQEEDRARARWIQMRPVDRQFALALLDALPAVVGALPPAARSDDLLRSSREPLREAYRLLRGRRWKRALRELLGRPTLSV